MYSPFRSLSFLSFFILAVIVFVYPFYGVKTNPLNGFAPFLMIVLVPVFEYHFMFKRAVFDKNLEEILIYAENLVKLFSSKSTLILSIIAMALASLTLIVESFSQDIVFKLGSVSYQADKIMLMIILACLYMVMTETFQTYLDSTKGFKDLKK